MKQFLLLALLITCSISYGQDTIVFKYGRIKQLDVLELKEDGTVIYLKKKDTLSIDIKEIIEFSNDGTWYRYDKSSKTIKTTPTSIYKIRHNFFNDNVKHEYGRFSISTDLVAPFINVDNTSSLQNLFLNTNRTLTIEPEYSVNHYFSIKMPITIGISSSRPDFLANSNTNIYGDSYLAYGLPILNDYSTTSISAGYQSYYWYDGDPQHKKDLIFQIGISPKLYPFGQKKQALYIAQSLSFGVMDYFSNTYYADFDTTINGNGSSSQYITWNLLSETVQQQNSRFFYARYEALLGINFNFSKIINFSTELGFSTYPKNKGINDVANVRIPGSGYTTVPLDIYQYQRINARPLIGYIVGRIHLVVKIPYF